MVNLLASNSFFIQTFYNDKIIIDFVGNCGNINFDGKWAPFLESLLQLHLLKLDTRDHYTIKYLFKLSIYPEKQYQTVSSNGNKLINNIIIVNAFIYYINIF